MSKGTNQLQNTIHEEEEKETNCIIKGQHTADTLLHQRKKDKLYIENISDNIPVAWKYQWSADTSLYSVCLNYII